MIGLAGGEGSADKRREPPTLEPPCGCEDGSDCGRSPPVRSGPLPVIPLMTLERLMVALGMFHPH